MKYLFLMILSLFMVSSSLAQNVETPRANDKKETIKVYENTNGIQNITFSQVIEKSDKTTKIYGAKNGIKNITPSKVLIRKGNTVREYKINGGIRSITPTKTYRVQEK